MSAEDIEQLFTTSKLLKAAGANFEPEGNGIWKLTYRLQAYRTTFIPTVFDEHPSLRFMTFGELLFERFLQTVLAQQSESK